MKLAYGIYNNMTKTNNMKQKCIHCDGLGYFYNQATFRSEHCPHCNGTGEIEIQDETPAVVEAPVAPKTTKKTTKTVVETPVVEEPTVDTNSGGDVDGGE